MQISVYKTKSVIEKRKKEKWKADVQNITNHEKWKLSVRNKIRYKIKYMKTISVSKMTPETENRIKMQIAVRWQMTRDLMREEGKRPVPETSHPPPDDFKDYGLGKITRRCESLFPEGGSGIFITEIKMWLTKGILSQ